MKANVTFWLEDTAKRFPEKKAFIDEKKEVSFAGLREQARAMGSGIAERGLFKKPVAIFLPKGVDALIAFLGVAYSGNFYSPIDVRMPANRINRVLMTLQPSLVITSKELSAAFAQCDYIGEILLLEEEDFNIRDDLIARVQSKCIDTDLLYVLFTSGSTGMPKGVCISHRSVIDYIDWVTDTFSICETDSFGNQAPFYFDNSILDIYSALKTGATAYIIPKDLFSQPVLLLEYLKERKINTIFWVPSALIIVARIRALRSVDLSDVLKRVLFCGEVMPNKQLNAWRKYLPDVLYANLYGPTEITDACTYYIVDREFSDEEPLPIGIPAANTDILVLNEKNELAGEGEIGELCVRGTCLSLGYYNNPEKTKEVFVQNPLNPYVPEMIYRTGDLVKYNEYGELVYLSRKDFQIKHMGHRIELGEIETAVSSLDEISGCCCLYDEERNKIVLFIDADVSKADVNSRISKLVPEYMLPNKVVTLKNLPINANGKIDRVKLRKYL